MNLSEVIDPTFKLVPWVVLFPLIGLLLNLLIGRRLGEKTIGAIASLAVAASFGVAAALAFALGRSPEPMTVKCLEWISTGTLSVGWNFRVDTLSVVMMLVVSGVGALIHIYAVGYMHSDVRHNGDPGRFRRFFVYFNLFIVAMMILVTADNYLMLFVGWEGVGLCSYLLIGFWFEKGKDGIGNARAAQKAFVVNRIGDFGLLIALFLIFWTFGSFDFRTVFTAAQQLPAGQMGIIVAITLFMLLGVTGKSAQLPLYVWLPDAMAGPTPVSALIHAATMVTAGVYLVARSQPLYSLVPEAQNVVVWVGVLTAVFAATIAVGQYDIKKVLAYSTISQLGFMVAAVGMGAFTAGMFHLTTHAFFKALLFLSAGSVIIGMEHGQEASPAGQKEHSSFDPQDMRNMGGLQNRMKTTFWVYLIGALALSGIAPLAGFFSKDEILAAALKTHPAVFVLLLVGAFLTAFYMGRQLWMVFFGKPRTAAAEHAVESPPLMTVPLLVLAALSALGGLINFPGLLPLEHWLEHTLGKGLDAPFEIPVALGSLLVAVGGLFAAWLIYGQRSLGTPETPDPLAARLGGVFRGMEQKWWVDELYSAVIVRPYRYISQEVLTNWFDVDVIDRAANGIGKITQTLSLIFSKLQNGFVRTYALFVLLGVVVMMTYLVLR